MNTVAAMTTAVGCERRTGERQHSTAAAGGTRSIPIRRGAILSPILSAWGVMGFVGFIFWSAVALAPVLVAVSVAGRFVRPYRLSRLALLAVVLGFIAGGAVGWASVPPEWSASFWTTIEAAGNSAKYGEPFEHTAERALMYFFYSAFLGELAFGLAALVVVWRIPRPPSGQRST